MPKQFSTRFREAMGNQVNEYQWVPGRKKFHLHSNEEKKLLEIEARQRLLTTENELATTTTTAAVIITITNDI